MDIQFELGFSTEGLLSDDPEVWGKALASELRAGPPILPLMDLLRTGLVAAADLQLRVHRRDEREFLAACEYFEAISARASPGRVSSPRARGHR